MNISAKQTDDPTASPLDPAARPTPSAPPSPSAAPAPATPPGRSARLGVTTPLGTARPLADDVLDELTSWQSRLRMAMFQSWARNTLSLIHLSVLAALEANGPLSMTRLAETMGVSVASATGIVTRMEKRGVVRRRHDEDDRRVVLVEITDAGAKVSRVMETYRRRRLAKLLHGLTQEELSSFLFGLRALGAVRLREGHDIDVDDEATDDEATADNATDDDATVDSATVATAARSTARAADVTADDTILTEETGR